MPSSPRLRAFTLIEMIVSMGILVVMMAMVGTVFQSTTESTGQARALMEISQTVRLLRDTLMQDLKHVNSQRSILVIQANAVNAYWKVEHRELDPGNNPFAGYTHPADPEREVPAGTGAMDLPRADMLMFFTSRKQRSVMYPDIWSNIAQIVYGHAELGELNNLGAWVGGPPTPFPPAAFPGPGLVFNTPAENWHLARRAVLLVDTPETSLDQYDPAWTGPADDVPNTIDDLAVDVSGAANAAHVSILKDGLIDVVDGTFAYDQQVANRISLAAPLPTLGLNWLARSRMDLQPPAVQGGRMGHYFAPKCASFKVEWALDLRKLIPFTVAEPAPTSLVWMDPARKNPLGALDPMGELTVLAGGYTDPLIIAALTGLQTVVVARFNDALGNLGINAQTPVWFANDFVNGGSRGQADRYFPVALRITVDLYDQARRLERPMRQVFILPIGSG